MKKFFSLIICVTFSLFLVACSDGSNKYGGMKRSPAAKIQLNEPLNANMDAPKSLTIPKQVEALLDSYIVDGKYTKLTTLTYDDNAANYHAGANTSKRRTYYDETESVNALLMGNYDGTFTTINSGYAKTGTNDMAHYTNSAPTITTSNLFTFTDSDVDYIIRETTPLGYYDLLSELADEVGKTEESRWSKDDYGRYVYTAPEKAVIQNGSYNNGLLKMFQYFAAPMLLLSDGIGLQKVAIVEKGGYVGGESANILQIQLFSSTNAMVSYAYVVKGLTMEEVVDAEIYLKPGCWKADSATFFAYFFVSNSDNEWVKATQIDNNGNYYKIVVPYERISGKMILVREKSTATTGSWGDMWNQTEDIKSISLGKTYEITGWSDKDYTVY